MTTRACGVRRTIAPVAGRYYDFHTGGAELVVHEVELEGPGGRERSRLQLLDPGAALGGGAWGADLPPRLRELHSHWLDRCAAADGACFAAAPLLLLPCRGSAGQWRLVACHRPGCC